MHTYSSAGTYIVKGNVGIGCRTLNIGPLNLMNDSFKNTISKILQFPSAYVWAICRCFNVSNKKLTYANFDKANILNLYEAFENNNTIKEIRFTNCTFKDGTDHFCTFSNVTSLTTLNYTGTSFLKCDWGGYTPINLVNFIADEESFGKSFSLTSTSLTDESLRIALLALAPVESTQTLTIGSTNLARLTPEQIKVATDKNWTVV